ncbi:alpha/beta fold hydrolase [Saccharopolyspora pogona]|uniref:alpha/beta fold hydrolase n=1 Tax=Saccharopolyspora pogona TaxID=333966 RepID=UPI0016854EF1|nr:alpha/beta fold hydrolase [Saccharopolyspora pogona]
MDRVKSQDGTLISYERSGSGPGVVLVSAALGDGTENAPLSVELSRRFTVLNYARRGRGGSGDTLPYALEREFEDLAAVIQTVDEPRYLYGGCSGGALALEAAAAGLTSIAKIAVYEVPYNMSAEWLPQWRDYVDAVQTALAAGERGAALELFLRTTAASEEDVVAARSAPFSDRVVSLAHTLAYDASCLGSGQPSPARLASVQQPTLVLTGTAGDAPDAAAWLAAMDPAAEAMVAALPRGQRGVLGGQAHFPDPAVLAAALTDFFAD